MPPSALVPQATDPYLEPRRAQCPWCGSPRLRTRLRAPDPPGARPDAAALDECDGCGHVFRNPRPTAEGLALHRRDDVREGPPERLTGRLPSVRAVRRRHRAAARALTGLLPDPESWLDVGTGDALFPEAAREYFPYTSFDGLDPSARVVRALVEGRVEEAHRGLLTTPGTAERLCSRYDVLSMFHHLEHVPDPRAELDAALRVLRPGGHLVVEVADPRCAFAALLGRWWLPHGRSRHLQLMPLGNLRVELESRGCTVLSAERGVAHVPRDLAAALGLVLDGVPAALHRTAVPALAVASAVDRGLAPLSRRTRLSNAYRLVARREV
ncbi:class I SAM-dependent methyltransferase [Streptomyces sp. NPDC005573]|uniref:class I SAM-dependent methyltransferase n=1 Tax=Streptomyces sp. NPDC005573 TaxID=3156890 RepID=UPI0033A4F0D0